MKNTSPVNIKNIDHSIYNLPIIEYAIKGSYNTAYTGNFMNKDAIDYVLSRGCRYIDLEVYLGTNKVPIVSIDNDISFSDLKLSDAFVTIVTSAFNTNKSPNIGDPLFVNIRCPQPSAELYSLIYSYIQSNLSGKLYGKPITHETRLSDIGGNIVLLFDKTMDKNWKKTTSCLNVSSKTTCHDLSTLISLESGSEQLLIYSVDDMKSQYPVPIYIKNDNIRTNAANMFLIQPNTEDVNRNNNSNITRKEVYTLITKHGSQIIPFWFYLNDGNLADYEKVFDDNKTAFIPLSQLVTYYSKFS
jgi:hypothetical protein